MYIAKRWGSASRNPPPRNHLLVLIVKSPGCHCRDALGGEEYRRVPTSLRSASPFSEQPACPQAAGGSRPGTAPPREPSSGVNSGQHF